MTLAIAWVRKVLTTEELVVATDSRLRFGCAWDCCPKIYPLSRGDAAICFAGNTMYAYPIMEQFRNAVTMYPKSNNRAKDLCDLKGHTLRVVRQMEGLIHDLPKGKKEKERPDIQFLFAGYSWAKARFMIWELYYNKARKQFEYQRTKTLYGNKIALIGDYTEEVKKEIIALLKSRSKSHGKGFDMEPFEALRDMCRKKSLLKIGGPPQVVKIYKHMNIMPYAIYWPTKASGNVSLMGRPLLNYEKTSYLVLDPDTLQTEDFQVAGKFNI